LKLRTKAAAYGLAGLALAGAAIFSGSTLGLLTVGSSGILSVLLTDPPSVPNGVAAVYVSYSSIAVHATGPNDSGWVPFSGQGTIDTMKLVNLSQTISSGIVPALTYDMVEFNISEVQVAYMGSNYTATIASSKLVAPIVGGVEVSSSSPAAALIDIQPTILNLGSRSSPEFTMAAGAKALMIPSDEVNDSMKHVGSNYTLQGHDWFQTFEAHHFDHITVSVLSLTSGSFAFSVANGGSDPVTIRMVILTPLGQVQGPGEEGEGMMGSMAGSVFFTVQSDGTLRLVGGTPGEVGSFLGTGGYTLASGGSHTFSYAGSLASILGMSTLSSGGRYSLVLMGSDALASQTATVP
jgi:hypothetical protein